MRSCYETIIICAGVILLFMGLLASFYYESRVSVFKKYPYRDVGFTLVLIGGGIVILARMELEKFLRNVLYTGVGFIIIYFLDILTFNLVFHTRYDALVIFVSGLFLIIWNQYFHEVFYEKGGLYELIIGSIL